MAYSDKPIDEARTTRPRAGMAFKDRRELPGLALTVVGVLAIVGCLTAAATQSTGWAIGLGAITLLTLAGGIGAIFAGRKRTARAGNHRSQRYAIPRTCEKCRFQPHFCVHLRTLAH